MSGSTTTAADAGYGWLHQQRSPQALASQSWSDTFGEEKILLHYHQSSLGRKRYAVVQWARRLAGAATPARTPRPAREAEEGHEIVDHGLEWVLPWSVKRLILALILVGILSVAATLLWTLLAIHTVGGPTSYGGYRDAGEGVGGTGTGTGTGLLFGICVVLLGSSAVVGWLSGGLAGL